MVSWKTPYHLAQCFTCRTIASGNELQLFHHIFIFQERCRRATGSRPTCAKPKRGCCNAMLPRHAQALNSDYVAMATMEW